MPYAHRGLCPMPYARRVPHVTEKGYIYSAMTLNFGTGVLNCRLLLKAGVLFIIPIA